MDKKSLYEKVNAARARRFLTNCYSVDVLESGREVWENGDELLIAYEDHGIDRLTFFARTWDSLDGLLTMPTGGRYYLEFMTKDPREYIPKASLRRAAMMRMANADCRSALREESPLLRYRGCSAAETAAEADAAEINGILWSTFHTEISHLLTDDELREKLRAGQFTVHRDANARIDALLQAEVQPKKFYINQVVNRGEPGNIHAIMLDRLERYASAGGKYLYAWVEEGNIASVKFHEKYGMRHDGMWSMIYSIER